MTTENVVRKTVLREKSQLMSASEIERTLIRVAHEIVEKNDGVEGLGLVGIRRRGVPLADRLGKLIGRIRGAIERTFSVLKRRYGFVRMRYLGLKANAFHLDLTAIAFNLRTIAVKSR